MKIIYFTFILIMQSKCAVIHARPYLQTIFGWDTGFLAIIIRFGNNRSSIFCLEEMGPILTICCVFIAFNVICRGSEAGRIIIGTLFSGALCQIATLPLINIHIWTNIGSHIRFFLVMLENSESEQS